VQLAALKLCLAQNRLCSPLVVLKLRPLSGAPFLPVHASLSINHAGAVLGPRENAFNERDKPQEDEEEKNNIWREICVYKVVRGPLELLIMWLYEVIFS
jgi:hypothetical protein